jgi:hypothetical protein
MQLFYSNARFPEATVFDPFMGSGTTLVEALKLGARAIGRDINPVAPFPGAQCGHAAQSGRGVGHL